MRDWTGVTTGIEVIGRLQAETEKAVCVRIAEIDGHDVNPPRSKWIPLSQIEASVHEGNSYRCIIPSWLGSKISEEIVS